LERARHMRLAAVVILAMSSAALADVPPETQALFDQGIKDMQSGKLDTACKELAAALARYPDMGIKGALATCYTKVNKTASAWTLWRELADTETDGVRKTAANSVAINLGLSIEVGRTFPDAYFDWIYIDTDHSYPTTRDELAVYESKMKPGGIIAGHDYVMGNWRGSLKFGVIEAVHEFCIARNWELLYVTTEQTTNASFAIRKIGGA